MNTFFMLVKVALCLGAFYFASLTWPTFKAGFITAILLMLAVKFIDGLRTGFRGKVS